MNRRVKTTTPTPSGAVTILIFRYEEGVFLGTDTLITAGRDE
jgi:hypothetical protein